jgi:hypothetical protein
VLDAIAELMLEGVAWTLIPIEMQKRYGIVRPDGEAFAPTFAYQVMHRPSTWGHLCMGRRKEKYYAAWVFDESIAPPPNVTVARNILPGLYPDELRQRLIEEVHRRHVVGSGGKPQKSHGIYWGRGLFVCGACGANMVKMTASGHNRTTYTYLRCGDKFHFSKPCSEPIVREEDVKRYVQWMLFDVLERGDSWFEDVKPAVVDVETLNKGIKALQAKIESWMNELGSTDNDAVKAMYRDKIKVAGEQMQGMMAQAQADEAKVAKSSKHAQNRDLLRRNVLGMLASVGPERAFHEFWSQAPVKINQFLSGLLGGRRMVVKGRKVAGLV